MEIPPTPTLAARCAGAGRGARRGTRRACGRTARGGPGAGPAGARPLAQAVPRSGGWGQVLLVASLLRAFWYRACTLLARLFAARSRVDATTQGCGGFGTERRTCGGSVRRSTVRSRRRPCSRGLRPLPDQPGEIAGGPPSIPRPVTGAWSWAAARSTPRLRTSTTRLTARNVTPAGHHGIF